MLIVQHINSTGEQLLSILICRSILEIKYEYGVLKPNKEDSKYCVVGPAVR